VPVVIEIAAVDPSFSLAVRQAIIHQPKIAIMIPFLIFILLKRFHNQAWVKKALQIGKFVKAHINRNFMSLIISLLSLIPIASKAQNLQLNYKIMRGGNDIGRLHLEKNIVGNKSNLLLVSEIKTYILFLITVSVKESSTFENGKLIYSSQFRKTNGITKLDKQTRYVANKYEVMENGKKENLSFPFIGTNLLNLYFQEPISTNSVYCDKQQCFVKITKTPDGGYKMKFPDGNSNYYYYERGICTKIKISHTFYSVEIILEP
jgi:hypothetical protein